MVSTIVINDGARKKTYANRSLSTYKEDLLAHLSNEKYDDSVSLFFVRK